ncbi:MAG: rhodanese-like domain-containing protein [Alphaproteobacteria bacterium]|nr:rhodanese-like domain-containing protein [Alphaproteobacteria bacterium]
MWSVLSRLFGQAPAAVTPAPAPPWIEIEELRSRMAGKPVPLILDVRGAEEFDGPLGHIDGARNIPLPSLSLHIAELTRQPGPIVCVCLTDKRSAQAAVLLAQAGRRDVTVLRGGMKAWRGQG